ncbi:GIP [Symbiodinium sp. CCMP2592]|nr:GIP [Symbiodinium sp. CCMP2592]
MFQQILALTKLPVIPLQALPQLPPKLTKGGQEGNSNHQSRVDHNRDHVINFKRRGQEANSNHESQADHSRDHKINFKHRGPMRWTCLAQAGFPEKGVNEVHGDIPNEELAGLAEWEADLETAMEDEWYNAEGDGDEPWWDEHGEKPPEVTEEELRTIDRQADLTELNRLIEMGVARFPTENEDLSEHTLLTTKLVRDWRRRPGWIRRARLVAREFRTLAAWSSEMFAPASTLGTVHTLISYAITNNLQLTTLDVKDAYLNVDQPGKAIIQVDAGLLEEGAVGFKTLVLNKLLPGQLVGASAWFDCASSMLSEARLENFPKEPTVFKTTDKGGKSAIILHADDGLLASSASERERIVKVVSSKVVVQVGEPMIHKGDHFEFLKRRYVKTKDGVAVFSNAKYLEALIKAAGPNIKSRDSPADASFQEVDATKELDPTKAKTYKECVGRLLYLSHSRADIQMAVCVLASRMACPTVGAYKQLLRVIGYLTSCPDLGFMIKPVVSKAKLHWEGDPEADEMIYEVESVTDADWAGCRRSRRSRSAIQLYIGGGFVSSMVRSQRCIALSSAESEYLALVSGACEAYYIADVLRFLVGEGSQVRITLRTDSAACRGICQRLGVRRVRHLQCAILWVQQAVRNKQLSVASISGSENPFDIGTKPLPGARIKELLYTMGCIESDGTPYGQEEHEAAHEKRMMTKMLKDAKSSGFKVSQVKGILPLILLLSQVGRTQGLSLALPVVAFGDADWVATFVVTIGFGMFLIMVLYGIPLGLLKLLKWGFSLFPASDGETGGPERKELSGIQGKLSKVHPAQRSIRARGRWLLGDRLRPLFFLLRPPRLLAAHDTFRNLLAGHDFDHYDQELDQSFSNYTLQQYLFAGAIASASTGPGGGGGFPLHEFRKNVPPGWSPGLPDYPLRLYFDRLKLWYQIFDGEDTLTLRLPRPDGGVGMDGEALARLTGLTVEEEYAIEWGCKLEEATTRARLQINEVAKFYLFFHNSRLLAKFVEADDLCELYADDYEDEDEWEQPWESWYEDGRLVVDYESCAADYEEEWPYYHGMTEEAAPEQTPNQQDENSGYHGEEHSPGHSSDHTAGAFRPNLSRRSRWRARPIAVATAPVAAARRAKVDERKERADGRQKAKATAPWLLKLHRENPTHRNWPTSSPFSVKPPPAFSHDKTLVDWGLSVALASKLTEANQQKLLASFKPAALASAPVAATS